MARYTGSKNRIARRYGVNIFGRARNPLLHKPNPPGVHGARRRKKSDYGLQLEEKQKLKAIYGMLSEKQLVRYYKKAANQEGHNTASYFAEQLECRLDNVVYRLKFANTIFAAHQLVSHGHILVNGKKVDIRSFQVKPGMVISIKEKSRKNKAIQNAMEGSRSVPEYLSFDKDHFSGQLLARPVPEQMPWPIEISLPVICDFLAHTT